MPGTTSIGKVPTILPYESLILQIDVCYFAGVERMLSQMNFAGSGQPGEMRGL